MVTYKEEYNSLTTKELEKKRIKSKGQEKVIINMILTDRKE